MRLRRALLLFILEVDMLENTFKTGLVKELKSRFPGCIVLHADPNEIQGIPDLVILYEDTWAALEGKKSSRASHRPNQDYYVEKMNGMCCESERYLDNCRIFLFRISSTPPFFRNRWILLSPLVPSLS